MGRHPIFALAFCPPLNNRYVHLFLIQAILLEMMKSNGFTLIPSLPWMGYLVSVKILFHGGKCKCTIYLFIFLNNAYSWCLWIWRYDPCVSYPRKMIGMLECQRKFDEVCTVIEMRVSYLLPKFVEGSPLEETACKAMWLQVYCFLQKLFLN